MLRSAKDSDCAAGDFCENISKLCIPLLPKFVPCPDGDHSCATGAFPRRRFRDAGPRASACNVKPHQRYNLQRAEVLSCLRVESGP